MWCDGDHDGRAIKRSKWTVCCRRTRRYFRSEFMIRLQGDTEELWKPPDLGCSVILPWQQVATVTAHQLQGVSDMSQRDVFIILLWHPVIISAFMSQIAFMGVFSAISAPLQFEDLSLMTSGSSGESKCHVWTDVRNLYLPQFQGQTWLQNMHNGNIAAYTFKSQGCHCNSQDVPLSVEARTWIITPLPEQTRSAQPLSLDLSNQFKCIRKMTLICVSHSLVLR